MRDEKMKNFEVEFFEKKYTYPNELRQYVLFCNEFEMMDTRFLEILIPIMMAPFASDSMLHSQQVKQLTYAIKDGMHREVEKIIKMLASEGIYDVVKSDLLEKNAGFLHFTKAYDEMMYSLRMNLEDEVGSNLSVKEKVRDMAYSQVTGSGTALISSSLLAHMTFAAFETNTINKQRRKAERDFSDAMNQISAYNASERNSKDIKVMKNMYEETAHALKIFVSELQEDYLSVLHRNGVFDYSKIKVFDAKRSSELLKNLTVVADKKSVIKAAFENCPYNSDVYVKAIEYGLADYNTLCTAKCFYQEGSVGASIKKYCQTEYVNVQKLELLNNVMCFYACTGELETLRELCEDKVAKIKNDYKKLKCFFSEGNKRGDWIKEHVNSNLLKIANDENDIVKRKITKLVDDITINNLYEYLWSKQLFSAEDIRLPGSELKDWKTINQEFKDKLIEAVEQYVSKWYEDYKENERIEHEKQLEKARQQKNREIKRKKIMEIIFAIISLVVIGVVLFVGVINPRQYATKCYEALAGEDISLAVECFEKSNMREEDFQKALGEYTKQKIFERNINEFEKAYYMLTDEAVIEEVRALCKEEGVKCYEEKQYGMAYVLLGQATLYGNVSDTEKNYYKIATEIHWIEENLNDGHLYVRYLEFIEKEGAYDYFSQEHKVIIDEMKDKLEEMQGYYTDKVGYWIIIDGDTFKGASDSHTSMGEKRVFYEHDAFKYLVDEKVFDMGQWY